MTKSLKVNGSDVTSAIVDNHYTINSIRADINVNISFEAMEMTFEKDGIHYLVSSFTDHQVTVTSGDNQQVLEVPAKVAYADNQWEVTGIREDALSNCTDLAAGIWNPGGATAAIGAPIAVPAEASGSAIPRQASAFPEITRAAAPAWVSLSADARSYTFEGLDPDGDYVFAVRAVNGVVNAVQVTSEGAEYKLDTSESGHGAWAR